MKVWLKWNCPETCPWWIRGTNAQTCHTFQDCPLGMTRQKFIVVDKTLEEVKDWNPNMKLQSNYEGDWREFIYGPPEKVIFI